MRAPSIFFGHGNPMNAIVDNPYARAWSALGQRMRAPRAVLAVSAHWYVEGTAVTAMPSPRTIHDFGGFPKALYRVQYPAAGDPALAARVRELLAPEVDVALDSRWGLDHGTWSVLMHVFPDATVPIVQLSIDETKPPQFHYELGRRLAPLRDEGVLIAGSGNVVHNLETMVWAESAQPYDWAERFDRRVRELVAARDHAALVDYPSLGADAMQSIPTPDHYLPLLYVLGASNDHDSVDFPVEGIDGGSVSMLAITWGS
ncbi:MAG: 4,5-DOPA dioxygenase extradiol [Candidatus Eremiobacteraeota bacterium]|nr:4,5-DOPA dioxygenase extradiol [Candidatus Eremiobacteraeota bacterium]